MAFDWSTVIGPALMGAASVIAGVYGANTKEDIAAEDRRYGEAQAEKERAFRREMAELAEGKGPFLGFTDPQKVSAMQSQQRNRSAEIQALINAYQRALLSGR